MPPAGRSGEVSGDPPHDQALSNSVTSDCSSESFREPGDDSAGFPESLTSQALTAHHTIRIAASSGRFRASRPVEKLVKTVKLPRLAARPFGQAAQAESVVRKARAVVFSQLEINTASQPVEGTLGEEEGHVTES